MSGGKSNRPSTEWSSIILSWVNLFEKETVTNISAIRTSQFFVDTILTIYKFNRQEDVMFKNSDDLAVTFIKEYFPEVIKEKRFSVKNEEDILVLVSLLMYTTCIKCKIETYVHKTCNIKLESNHEEAMKRFFELLLTFEKGHFTRRNIMGSVRQCFEPVAVCSARKSLSPSPKKTCLKELGGSPLLEDRYKKRKNEYDVKHFNALLQEENSELLSVHKALTKRNEELEESVKILKTHLDERIIEITSLREESCQNKQKEFPEKTLNQKEKILNKEINELNKDLKDSQMKIDTLIDTNVRYEKQIKDLKTALDEKSSEIIQQHKIIVEMDLSLVTFKKRNIFLENEVEELKQVIEQYEEERAPKEELNMSAPRVEENLGQVLFELQLEEKEQIINQLENQLNSLEVICNDKIRQHETSKMLLQDELQLKCLEVENTTSALNGLMSQVKANEAELKNLTDQVKTLKTKNEILENNITASLTESKDIEEHLANSLKNVARLKTVVGDKEHQIDQMKTLIQNLSEDKKEFQLRIAHKSAPRGLKRTRSHDQLGIQNQHGARVVEEETFTVSKRQRIQTVPSKMGKVLPSTDEAEEMFNNDCLADQHSLNNIPRTPLGVQAEKAKKAKKTKTRLLANLFPYRLRSNKYAKLKNSPTTPGAEEEKGEVLPTPRRNKVISQCIVSQ